VIFLVENDEGFPLGQLPKNIIVSINYYVKFAKQFEFNSEIKNSSIQEFISDWKSIQNCNVRSCKDNPCNSCNKKLTMLKECGVSESKYNRLWEKHNEETESVRAPLFQLFTNMKDKIKSQILKIGENCEDHKIAEWCKHPTLNEFSSKIDFNHQDLGGYDAILEQYECTLKWREIKDLFHKSRMYRNALEHSKDVLQPDYELKQKNLSGFDRYFDLVGPGGQKLVREHIKSYLEFMGLGEEWRDLHKDDNFILYCTKADSSSLYSSTKSKNVKKLLGLIAWKDYVPVESKDGSGKAINLLINYFSKNTTFVDINGVGGLGKTALSYEYIRRVTDDTRNTNDIAPYEHIIFFTSKSKEQGEHATEWHQIRNGEMTLDPRNPFRGYGVFVSEMDYISFIDKICKMDKDLKTPSEPSAIRILRENRYLVVIDNFEDVTKENKVKYRDLLMEANGGKSNIIITSRPEEMSPIGMKINLGHLNQEEANLLLQKRFKHMMGRHSVFNGRTKDFDELNNLREGRDLIGEIIDRLPESNKQQFLQNATHPQALFFLVSLMGDKDVQTKLNVTTNLNIVDYIVKIAETPEFEFLKFHDNLNEWSTKKAYDRVIENPNCKLIIQILRGAPAKVKEIKQDFVNLGENSSLVSDGIQILLQHNHFISYDEEGGEYSLLPSAHNFLETLEQTEPDHIANAIEDDLSKASKFTEIVTQDGKLLIEILDKIESDASDLRKTLQRFIERKPNIDSRKSVHRRTLKFIIVAIEKLEQLEENYSVEIKSLSHLVRSVLFKCFEQNHCNQVLHITMSGIIDLSMRLMELEESAEIKKEWILHSADDVLDNLATLSSEDKIRLFNLISKDNNLCPTGKDTKEFILAWTRFVSVFFKYEFYSNEKEATTILDVFSDLRNKHDLPIHDWIKDEFPVDDGGDEYKSIASFISTWTNCKPWKVEYYHLRNHFKLDEPEKEWKTPSDWVTYTLLPQFTTEDLESNDLSLLIYNLDSKDEIRLKEGHTYKTSFSQVRQFTNIIEVRCIDELPTVKKSRSSRDKKLLLEPTKKLIENVKKTLLRGISDSPQNKIAHSLLESNYETTYQRSISSELDKTVYSKSADFVVEKIIPLLKSVVTENKGHPNQSYRRTGRMPERPKYTPLKPTRKRSDRRSSKKNSAMLIPPSGRGRNR
jgi:hypothetical protein